MKLWHMSGAGNDFAVLDARGQQLDLEALAKKYCAQFHTDGFLALDVSEQADFRLHFYNPDGLRGEMCGNGARCICKFARDLGLVGDRMLVQTDAGLLRGWYQGGDRYKLQLHMMLSLDPNRREDAAYLELGDPGIPHSVTFLEQVDYRQKEALRPYAMEIRHDPVFPKGVNVNFCQLLDDTHARILTYERGVEDFTQACGTGSVSVAALMWYRRGCGGQGVFQVENPGGLLTVTVEGGNRIDGLYLEGPAVTVGEYEI